MTDQHTAQQLKYGGRLSSICLTALVSVAFVGTAAAQSEAPKPAAPGDTNGKVEEIVVTAQRRGERLQSVPVSVSAFTAKTLAAAGVNDTLSLQSITPGLVIGQGLSASTPFIRGVGSSDLGPSNEAAVATYLDGIYLVASPSALFSFNNIDRIEVLKGPQGTLFGRNSSGGLIQVVTRTPEDTPTGHFELGYANYDTLSGSGYVSGGLGGGFAGDLAVTGSHQGEGWGHNLFNGSEDYKTSEYGARSKLSWRDPTTNVTLAVLYSERESSVGASFQPYEGGNAGNLTGNVGFANDGKYNIDSNFNPEGKVHTFVPSLSITKNFDAVTFVSLTSYQQVLSRVVLGQDGVPQQISDGNLRTSSKAYTQELQLLSPSSSNIKWIVGLFGLSRLGTYDPAYNYVPAGLIVTNGIQKTTSGAGFAQVTVPVGADNHITGGLRYTADEQDASVSRTFNGFSVGPKSTADKDYSNLSWRLSADHEFTSDIMVYASYNRGYKSGLFNLLNYPVATGEAKPEKIDAFEAGMKSDLLDGKLRLNGSAFLYEYTDLQVFFFLNGSAYTLNADKARIAGFEGEFTARPTSALTFRGGVTLLPDAEYTKFTNAPLTTPAPGGGNILVFGDGSGRRISRSPKVSANLGAEYDLQTPAGQVQLNVNANYLSNTTWATDGRLYQPAYALYNASVRLHVRDDTWISAWGRNLGDKYYYQYAQSPQTGDVGVAGAPRTFGVTVGYDF